MPATRKATDRVKIDKFFGINETDGGQTVLKNGESPYMRNFRIDDNGKLQKRRGWKRVFKASGYTIDAICSGKVRGGNKTVFIMNNKLYELNPEDGTYVSKINFGGDGSYRDLFYFKDTFYALANNYCYTYDGINTGILGMHYPYLKKDTKPDGHGEICDQPNLFTEYRNQLFSPDGVSKVFYLAEKQIGSVLSVINNGTVMNGYSVSETDGTLTFTSAPPAGFNTIKVLWKSRGSYGNANMQIIYKMRKVSAAGERLFLWGHPDFPNRIYWCGISEYGAAANYFCENCSAVIGNGRYAITDIIQQHDKYIIFTEGETWCATIKDKINSDGKKYTEFDCWQIHKYKGLAAQGAAQLINNKPVSLMQDGVYEWHSTNAEDELNAKLISQRVSKTIAQHDVSTASTFDDESKGEYWISFSDGVSVIYNYRVDAWYIYDGIPIKKIAKCGEDMYFSTEDGSICKFFDEYTDDGQPIECEWQMNFEGFGTQYTNKNLLRAYIGLDPETHANYELLWQTDNDCSTFYSDEKIMGTYAFFGYDDMQFDAFSYDTLYAPKVFRHRLMLKRFSYVKLYIKNNQADKGCTLVCLTLEGYPSGEPKKQI